MTQFKAHWRISTFRLAVIFGLIFIVGNVALLSLVYWQTSSYLAHRIDDSINRMAQPFDQMSAHAVTQQIDEALQYDLRKTNLYGLFTSSGEFITGNISKLPPQLKTDSKVEQFALSTLPPFNNNVNITLSANTLTNNANGGLARLKMMRLSNGMLLVIGRDFTQLAEIKAIILRIFLMSGGVISIAGLCIGFMLSVRPLQRITLIRHTCQKIMQGQLQLRLPVSERHDEIDMLNSIVNTMLDEIERLLTEVKSVTDTIAHDLRTPLTRLKLTLARLEQQLQNNPLALQSLEQAHDETEQLLARFRAILRLSEIENQQRKNSFKPIFPDQLMQSAFDLFEPLAEEAGLKLTLTIESTQIILADSELLFEAVTNLIDNAIKFSPQGCQVQIVVRLDATINALCIDVIDQGCGIPIAQRSAVLQRFHRIPDTKNVSSTPEGFGLGLSIVASILRLHGFNLQFKDVQKGTFVTLICNLDL